MNTAVIYRCPRKCTIGKSCFIIKLPSPLKTPLEILQKCPAMKGEDISIVIGDDHTPPILQV